MFNKTFVLHTTFDDVNGLTAGNNVRYSGMDVGTVERIEMKNDTTVHVEMIIDEKYKHFIRKNSMASVGTDGLMGNKLVNIDAGTSASPFVTSNDEIPSVKGVNTEAMLRTLEFTNQNVALVSANLKTITDNINESHGTLYTVLMDTMLATNFQGIFNNIESVSANLSNVSSQLANIVNDVNNGKGTLGVLLKDTVMSNDINRIVKNINESGEQLSSATKEANTLFKNAKNGNGAIATLVNDTALSSNLKSAIVNLETATQKLNEDLEGLKHSFLLRRYFKKQEQKKKK
jgi:phospholipid/cholesterol/gamma-HCH transport system substrate-binding protein